MDKAVATAALQWLSCEDHVAEHNRLKAIRHRDSLQWFIESKQFQEWLADEQQVLVCFGSPGSGKTVATSKVVDTLLETFGASSKIGIALFYPSSGQDPSPEHLLRCILYELGRRLPSTPAPLINLYQNYGTKTCPPSVQQLLDTMTDIVKEMSKTYLVIDGFDELSTSQRGLVLSGLLELRQRFQVSLFVTSRRVPDVVQRLEVFPFLDMREKISNPDLMAYITHRVKEILIPARHRRNEERSIAMRVLLASGGLFLVARLRMDLLTNASKKTGRVAVVSPVGGSLHDLYAKRMSRVERRPENEKSLVKKALAWLLYAQRPLKKAELQHALGTEENSSDLIEDHILDVAQIITLCEGFVMFTESNNVWAFVHRTAAEYLQGTRNTWFSEAESMVTIGCWTYLTLSNFDTGYCNTDEEFEMRLRDYPLYSYAAEYWVHHLRTAPSSLEKFALSILMKQDIVTSVSQTMQCLERESRPAGYSQAFDHKQTGLHLAAQYDLNPPVDILLDKKQQPGVKDINGYTPLWRAVNQGSVGAIRSLMHWDRTTLALMLEENQRSPAYSLIRIAGQNIRDWQSRTAVHIGVDRNDLELVEHAIACGIGIDSRDMHGCSPLQLAMRNHIVPIIDLLLSHSASTDGVTVLDWIQAYETTASHVVELQEDTFGKKQIRFLDVLQFDRKSLPKTLDLRRLFMFPANTLWFVDDDTDPRSVQEMDLLYWKFSNKLVADEPVFRCSVLALIPVRIESLETQDFRYEFKETRISWTLKAIPGLRNKNEWRAIDHFSTLRAGSMPASGMAFFDFLVIDLTTTWLELCDRADFHLFQYRPAVLAANGEDTKLIRSLLSDANTWITLRYQLHRQIEAIERFRVEYLRYAVGDEAINTVTSNIKNFSDKVGLRIDKLDASSSALIQLEFNLTSIREAQKSTSLNLSIKRLTWVTFIFLPLTFVSGLFGMNVNALANNPPWWWYVVFISGTFSVTMTVWIVFKRYPGLEDVLEERFQWLVGPRKPKQSAGDAEMASMRNAKMKVV